MERRLNNIHPRLYSYFLVFCQFLFIGLLAISSNLSSSSVSYIFIVLLGLVLGIWSLLVMSNSKIRITPQVANGSKLIINGPYKFVRHPMYSSVILVCLGMTLSNFSLWRITIFVLLLIVLSLKIKYEEKLLTTYFSEYKEYELNSKKIIPFLI